MTSNLPRFSWDTLTWPDDAVHEIFVDFVINQGLTQLINLLTHGLNILHILLTNAVHIVTSICCLPPIGGSDHATIDFSLVCHLSCMIAVWIVILTVISTCKVTK